jgi:hypothetical protein
MAIGAIGVFSYKQFKNVSFLFRTSNIISKGRVMPVLSHLFHENKRACIWVLSTNRACLLDVFNEFLTDNVTGNGSGILISYYRLALRFIRISLP